MSHTRIGKAVEMLLAARLLLKGFHVAAPLDDDGVDLIVGYRIKVQIKSSARRDERGRLDVTLRTGNSKHGSREWSGRNVDVLAVFGRDSERWWLIPAHEFQGGLPARVYLTEHLSSRRTKINALSSYLDAWWVFDDPASRL